MEQSSRDDGLPLGLGMSLAQHSDALSYFGGLDHQTQRQIIAYVQGAATGDETKERISRAVDCLENKHTGFLS